MPSAVTYFYPSNSTSRFNIIFWMLVAIFVVVFISGVWTILFAMLNYFQWFDSIPNGTCPPRCVLNSDVQFDLTPKPNVTISYFCWNGIPQAEIIPAPDANSGAPFNTPDPYTANDVCRRSIESVPSSAMIFPYWTSQLVYGKCGIVYRCAKRYYSP